MAPRDQGSQERWGIVTGEWQKLMIIKAFCRYPDVFNKWYRTETLVCLLADFPFTFQITIILFLTQGQECGKCGATEVNFLVYLSLDLREIPWRNSTLGHIKDCFPHLDLV